MLAVVIPAKSEAARIYGVLRQALGLRARLVIPVLNGCTDMTAEIVRRVGDARIRPLTFREPLGVDVPRIAGARAALEAGATQVLFVDGDLEGRLQGRLTAMLMAARRQGLDLALADCYAGTVVPTHATVARQVYGARLALNEALGRLDLGAAIPSHGPVVVSRRLLESVPQASLGVPPLMQAQAIRAGLTVGIGVGIPHKELGSAERDREHRQKVAETIIGDCLQARSIAEGRPADREGHIGYHADRRFDLLGLEPPEGVKGRSLEVSRAE
jgi:hypothetical protein